MSSIVKTASGYQAQVFLKGKRKAKTFRTKREAEAWAIDLERQIVQQGAAGGRHTLREALERYREEISGSKRGARWEIVRITAFLADPSFPAKKALNELEPEDFGKWRDARLKEVSAGSILRDFSTLSPIIEQARKEWKWILINPLKDVKKPREPDHREITIAPMQAVHLLRVMGYKRGPCKSVTQAVCVAFLFALRTGVRAGEICALRWIDVGDGFVRVTGEDIGAGKTKAARREVPIVYQANTLIKLMRGWDTEHVFGLKSQTLDALFRRYRDKAGMDGVKFHDTRHTAATRISKKVDVLTLCKIFGWKTTTQALTYYNPKVDDIRRMLEPRRLR